MVLNALSELEKLSSVEDRDQTDRVTARTRCALTFDLDCQSKASYGHNTAPTHIHTN